MQSRREGNLHPIWVFKQGQTGGKGSGWFLKWRQYLTDSRRARLEAPTLRPLTPGETLRERGVWGS